MPKKTNAHYSNRGREVTELSQDEYELYSQSELSMRWSQQEHNMRAKRGEFDPVYDYYGDYEPLNVYNYNEYSYNPYSNRMYYGDDEMMGYETEGSQYDGYYPDSEQIMYRRMGSVSEMESDYDYNRKKYRAEKISDYNHSQRKMNAAKPKERESKMSRDRKDLNVYVSHQPNLDRFFSQRKHHQVSEVPDSAAESMTEPETDGSEIIDSDNKTKSPGYQVYYTEQTRNNTYIDKILHNQPKHSFASINGQDKIPLLPLENPVTDDSLHKVASKIVYLPVVVMNYDEKSHNDLMKKPTLVKNRNDEAAERPLENVKVYAALNTGLGNLFKRTAKNEKSKKNNTVNQLKKSKINKENKSSKNNKTPTNKKDPYKIESSHQSHIQKKIPRKSKLKIDNTKTPLETGDLAAKPTGDLAVKPETKQWSLRRSLSNFKRAVGIKEIKKKTIPQDRSMLSVIMQEKELKELKSLYEGHNKTNNDSEKTTLISQMKENEDDSIIPKPTHSRVYPTQGQNKITTGILANVNFKEAMPEITVIERKPVNWNSESNKIQDSPKTKTTLTGRNSTVEYPSKTMKAADLQGKSVQEVEKTHNSSLSENKETDDDNYWKKRKSRRYSDESVNRIKSTIIENVNAKSIAAIRGEGEKSVSGTSKDVSKYELESIPPTITITTTPDKPLQKIQDRKSEVIPEKKFSLIRESILPLNKSPVANKPQGPLQKLQERKSEVIPEQKFSIIRESILPFNKSSAIGTRTIPDQQPGETLTNQNNKNMNVDSMADLKKVNKTELKGTITTNKSLVHDEKSQNQQQQKKQASNSQLKNDTVVKPAQPLQKQQKSKISTNAPHSIKTTPSKRSIFQKRKESVKRLGSKGKQGTHEGRLILYGYDLTMLVYIYQIAIYFLGVSIHDKFIEVSGSLC